MGALILSKAGFSTVVEERRNGYRRCHREMPPTVEQVTMELCRAPSPLPTVSRQTDPGILTTKICVVGYRPTAREALAATSPFVL